MVLKYRCAKCEFNSDKAPIFYEIFDFEVAGRDNVHCSVSVYTECPVCKHKEGCLD